ncbi:hypothetical protein OS493_030456 [Desmophyllum pertusum]|uniref:Uncharacterized protein n=1 Tax=Desmophyllum pertusum TaxID=174260 RepID=A0A9W9YZZ4_9CNID|nr:hypothetical protein OS493_030456 [Desmophyllum pertusum]
MTSSGKSVTSITAEYANGYRRWKFECRDNKAAVKCQWTTLKKKQCPKNGFISGINYNSDHTFSFQCCNNAKQYVKTKCKWSWSLSNSQNNLGIWIPEGYYLAGIKGNYNDSRWQVKYCKLKSKKGK